MREALFIKKNVGRWNDYQHMEAGTPDETAERFVNLIDDLSFSKTFYPRSRVTQWLNNLASGIYQNIYRNKKEKYSRFFDFWKYELPLLFKKYHNILLFTTLVFLLFVLVGFFSQRQDPSFIRNVLGDRYVDMTERNIANGDPFGVYRSDNKFNMFVEIGINNIRVALLTFLSGLSLGFFTFKLLLSNGIMLGSFHEMFVAHGLGLQSMLVVWMHGAIEISSIVIAGAAGFIMAHGILFPGTYTRLESFKRKAKDAAKVMVAIVPFIILAAFIESYITYLMSNSFDSSVNFSIPIWLSVLMLIASFTLMIWYFIVRPIQLNKKGIFLKPDGILSRIEDENKV